MLYAKIMENYAIQPHCEAFFIIGMLFNCESAMDSIEDINTIFDAAQKKENADIIDECMNSILNNLQNIISQGASLSRFFWPSQAGEQKIHKKRAKYLREVFEVNENSPLKNRTLRNAIEHFDEKLDIYFQKPEVGFFLNKYIGPEPDRNGVKNHFFRAYFIDTATFEILGQKLKIEPLVEEIYSIYEKLEIFRKSERFKEQSI